MAENSPPPSQDNTSSGQANIRESQSINRVEVTRMDVQRGEIRELQHELLENVCSCIDEQTETLGKKLDDVRRALGGGGMGGTGGGRPPAEVAADQATRAAKERVKVEESIAELLQQIRAELIAVVRAEQSGSEGSHRGLMSDIAAAQAEHTALRKVLESTRLEIGSWGGLFIDGVLVQFQNNMRELNERVFRAAQRFADLNGAINAGKELGTQMLELSKTGMANLGDVMDLFATGMREERDQILATFQTVRETSEEGAFAIGEFGTNLREVGATFHQMRDILEGVNIDLDEVTMGLEEQNKIVTELVKLERRAGEQGSLQQILESRRFRRQFTTLQTIQALTGKQLQAVLDMTKETIKTVDELQAIGTLNESEADFARSNLALLQSVAPNMKDVALNTLRFGNDIAAVTRVAHEQFPRLAAISGGIEALHELAQLTTQTDIRTAEGQARLNRFMDRWGSQMREGLGSLTDVAKGDVTQSEQLLTNAFLELQQNRNVLRNISNIEADRAEKAEEADAKADAMLTEFREFVRSNFPEPLQKILQTAFGNVVGGIMAAVKGAGGAAVGGAAGAAGGAAAGGIAARALAGGGGGAARAGGAARLVGGAARFGLPGLAIGAGLGLGFLLKDSVGQAINDALGGERGTLGTRIFDLIHGARDEELTAPVTRADVGLTTTTTTPEGAKVPKPTPARASDMSIAELKAQTQSLAELIRLMSESNRINSEVADTIGASVLRPERAAAARAPGRDASVAAYSANLGPSPAR